jgi:hypothetical protein
MADDLIARIRRRADDPRIRTDSADISLTPRFQPVTASVLSQAERRLGFRLPPFLSEVYRKVGNGGFGPGYGLIGLPGGYADEGRSIVELYQSYRAPAPNDPDWQWPEWLVPVCNWGCAIFSCVDSRSGAVHTFDPNSLEPGVPMALAFAESHASVAAWLDDWANGVQLWDKMFEHDPEGDKPGINPFTSEPIVFRKMRLRR